MNPGTQSGCKQAPPPRGDTDSRQTNLDTGRSQTDTDIRYSHSQTTKMVPPLLYPTQFHTQPGHKPNQYTKQDLRGTWAGFISRTTVGCTHWGCSCHTHTVRVKQAVCTQYTLQGCWDVVHSASSTRPLHTKHRPAKPHLFPQGGGGPRTGP